MNGPVATCEPANLRIAVGAAQLVAGQRLQDAATLSTMSGLPLGTSTTTSVAGRVDWLVLVARHRVRLIRVWIGRRGVAYSSTCWLGNCTNQAEAPPGTVRM